MRLAFVVLALLLTPTPAYAQFLPNDQSLVVFERYIAVRERRLEGYDTPGIPLSTFTLQPSVDINTTYNDNVLALEKDARGDALLRVSPAASLNSNWSDSLLSLNAHLDIDRYATLTTENSENLNASVYGWTDLARSTRLRTFGRYQTMRESRESQDVFVLTRQPVRYRESVVGLGLSQHFARALLLLEGDVSKTDFDDAVRREDGAPVDQDFRDSVLKRVSARAEFGHSPSLAYFVQGTYNQRDYRLRATDPLASARASRITELLVGTRFELPILARGEIGVGYTRGSYRGVQFNPVSGLAIRTNVTLFPTQLTNIILTAERQVTDTGIPASGGYASLVGGVQVDHEYLRQLILSASARYRRDSFNGVDRRDRRFELGASASYRLNPNMSARASYSRIDLSSSGANAYKSFVANRFLIGIGLRP